ncbi:MAG: pentapeptide repeat-containing protein [Chloroflexi bacterium]|nr:pentapeptide repeat-containing protein [Chloroflexota bacterium]
MSGNTCASDGCLLSPYDRSGLCILHSYDPEKDATSFNKALEDKIARGKTADTIDLKYVVFPVVFNWSSKDPRNTVTFQGAWFLEPANFDAVVFFKEVDFRDAIFFEGASFIKAQFLAKANSSGATFCGHACFPEANFADATFYGAGFSGTANFRKTKFSGAADFRRVDFGQGADFSQSTFHSSLRLRHAILPTRTPARLNFRDVTLMEPAKVLFDTVDFAQASFLRTDVSEVRLVDVKWPHEEESWVTDVFGKTTALYDYRVLLKKECNRDEPWFEGRKRSNVSGFNLVGDTYRQFRMNLEDHRRHIEAGDFHVGEMEMRRLNPETHLLYRGLLWLYGLAANYGESYVRPLIAWFALAALFGALYLLTGFKWFGEKQIAYTFGPGSLGDFLADWLRAWLSAIATPPLPGPDFKPLGFWTSFWRVWNAVFNAAFISLTLIALRRRFKR